MSTFWQRSQTIWLRTISTDKARKEITLLTKSNRRLAPVGRLFITDGLCRRGYALIGISKCPTGGCNEVTTNIFTNITQYAYLCLQIVISWRWNNLNAPHFEVISSLHVLSPVAEAESGRHLTTRLVVSTCLCSRCQFRNERCTLELRKFIDREECCNIEKCQNLVVIYADVLISVRKMSSLCVSFSPQIP